MRCYRALALGAADEPEEVIFKLPDHGYDLRLHSCITCGARFVADSEYEHHVGVALTERIARSVCPSCGAALRETLRPYPQTFRTADGSLSHFELPRKYPSDDDSAVFELWNLDSIATT